MNKLIELPNAQMFSQLGSEFGTKFAEGFKGVSSGGIGIDISEQLKKLNTERERLFNKQKQLQKGAGRVDYLTELPDLASMDEVRPFSSEQIKAFGKNVDEAALKIQEDFTRIENQLSTMKSGTMEYQQTLINAYEAASNLYRMKGYIDRNPSQIKDKFTLSDYDHVNLADITGDLFDKYYQDLRNVGSTYYEPELAKVSTKLKEIDGQIKQIQQNNPDIINEQALSIGLKTLEEVEAAYKRILNAHGKVGKQGKYISDALNFDPTTSTKGIQALYDAYTKMPEDTPWETQYQALLKYVKLYESYLNSSNATHRNKVTKEHNEFTKLYDQIKPIVGDVETGPVATSLRNIINIANKSPLVGIDDTNIEKSVDVSQKAAAESQRKAEAETKARIESENKARADAEAASSAEKEKIAQEAVAKATQQSAAVSEKERAAKEATAKASKEVSPSYNSGNILDNPMFANMFGKAKNEAEEKQVANEGSAKAAQEELGATQKTTAELEKQQKLLLYRRVEGQLDINRIGNRSDDALYDKQGQPIIQGALEMGYGGYGDGLYGSVFSSAKDLIPKIKDGPVSFFEFDASAYNLYINKTAEQAESLRTFLLSLQKLVGSGTLLNTSELTHIADLSEDQLFEKAQQIFKNFSMTKEQFHNWLESAKIEAEKIAGMFAKGEVPTDRHNFGTRFMKALGYEGVLNRTGDAEYDGNTQGSVIYDPNVNDIRQNARVFNDEKEFAQYIKAEAQAHRENASAVNTEVQAQENLNKTKLQQQQIEQLDNDGAEVAEEKAKTEAIKQQNGVLQENLALKTQVNSQGVGSGDKVAPTGIDAQALPKGAISAEATELETVRSKIVEVTNAVNTKNQAFLAEQKVVKKVAQSEIHSLGEIEKKVASVKTAMANIHTQSKAVHTPEVNTEAFTQEGQVAEGAISQEMNSLTKLRAALQLTTKRINEKTQAFEAEKGVVNSVVNSEINALKRLNTQVDTINTTVLTLITNLQNVQTGVSNIPTPQAQPAPQNNTGAQGQGSSGGGQTSSPLLDAKINTQFSSLSLMYAQLESVGKLTPQIEQMWLQLWDSLSKVNDSDSLKLWREELQQVGNAMKEIMIANNLVEQEGVQSFQALINITKLYNKMAIGAAGAKTPEERDFYIQEANAALVEQQRILQGITLTKEQQARYDELEAQRKREISKIQAAQTGTENAKQQKQEEAIVIRELIDLYEQLGRARAQGDYTTASAIRGQIKTERGKLSTVDRATDDKFAQATAKGEQSVVDEANKAATKAQNEALRERQKILGELMKLHRELGALEAKEKSSAVSDSKRQQYRAEIYELYKQISAKEQLILLTQEEIDLLNQTHANAGRSSRISNAGEREAEIEKLKGQYEKLGEAQAKAEHDGTNEAKERFSVLAKEIAEKKKSLQLTQQELDMLRKIVAESYKTQGGILNKRDADLAFKQQIKDAQKQAGLSKSQSAETRAIETYAQASVLPGVTPEVQASLDAYHQKIQELHSAIASFPTDRMATPDEINRLAQKRVEVDALTKEMQELLAQQERLSGPNAESLGGSSTLGINASAEEIEAALTKQVQAYHKGRAHIKSYNAETQQLTYTVNGAKGAVTQYTAEINRTNGAMMTVRGTTTKAMGVIDALGKKIKEYSYYFTGSMMVYRVIGWVREGITAIQEIDKALTELKKVTNETETSYEKFLNTAAQTADKVGSTITAIVNSTADWARLNI
jgi:hypothetical protein